MHLKPVGSVVAQMKRVVECLAGVDIITRRVSVTNTQRFSP